jgi:hypothetical protein
MTERVQEDFTVQESSEVPDEEDSVGIRGFYES